MKTLRAASDKFLGFIDRTGNGGDLRHQTLVTMAQNRAASSDTEALELLKAAGLTDSEISEANLLRAIVDRIPTTQARETITRCAIVRTE